MSNLLKIFYIKIKVIENFLYKIQSYFIYIEFYVNENSEKFFFVENLKLSKVLYRKF